MRTKPTVGQTVYVLNVGNAARHHDPVLRQATVGTVGRKFFTVQVESWYVETFHIDTWLQKTDYSPTSRLYEFQQEYYDAKDRLDISNMLREFFSVFGPTKLSLEALRKIRAVVLDDCAGK